MERREAETESEVFPPCFSLGCFAVYEVLRLLVVAQVNVNVMVLENFFGNSLNSSGPR